MPLADPGEDTIHYVKVLHTLWMAADDARPFLSIGEMEAFRTRHTCTR